MSKKYHPTCHQILKDDATIPQMYDALLSLRRERVSARKNTMTHAGVMRLFAVSCEQVDEIPSVVVFGEIRYRKEDVMWYVQSKKIRSQKKMNI